MKTAVPRCNSKTAHCCTYYDWRGRRWRGRWVERWKNKNRKIWKIMTAEIPTSGRTCTFKGVCDLASVEMLPSVSASIIFYFYLLVLVCVSSAVARAHRGLSLHSFNKEFKSAWGSCTALCRTADVFKLQNSSQSSPSDMSALLLFQPLHQPQHPPVSSSLPSFSVTSTWRQSCQFC